jgi:hypothetical protein
LTVNWIVVSNGNDSTVPGPSTTANTEYAYLRTNSQTVSTPANGTYPTGWGSVDIDGDSTTQYVYRAEVTTTIYTDKGVETSRDYKWSAPMLYKAYNNKK